MAVQFKVINEQIHADIVFSQAFQEVVEVLKRFRSMFNPSSKSWIIHPSTFEELCGALEDIDTLYVSESNQKAIDELKNPKPSVRVERIPFDRSNLKVPPIVGKHPFENYQLEDITRCVNRNRWALFNEQGLGKSYEIISALDILRQNNKIQKVLFVTSASGVYNIKREFAKFSGFDPARIAVGGTNDRTPFRTDIDIVICNYRSLLLISDHYYKLKNKKKSTTYRKSSIPLEDWIIGNAAFVLDESQNIANPKARQTKAVEMIKDYFDYRYLLSGTPYDKEEKIYSQLNFLDSAFVHNYSYFDWLSEYANLGNRFSAYAINYFRKDKKEKLTGIVASTCSRRFSDECLDLPEHLIKPIIIPFDNSQKEIYQEIIVQKLKLLNEQEKGLRSQSVINSFPYLILGVDNPHILLKHAGENNELLPEKTLKKIKNFKFENHSKIEALQDLLDKHKIEKIVLWTSHPSVGFELQKLVGEEESLIINGEVPRPKGMELDEFKGQIVSEFESNPKKRILIAGIQVFSTAVTMVCANVQIVFDSTFSFIDYSQALKRIHRIGQSKTVYTYVLLIDNSLDMLRYDNLQDKEFINNNFLKKEYLDKDTIRNMFEFSDERI